MGKAYRVQVGWVAFMGKISYCVSLEKWRWHISRQFVRTLVDTIVQGGQNVLGHAKSVISVLVWKEEKNAYHVWKPYLLAFGSSA